MDQSDNTLDKGLLHFDNFRQPKSLEDLSQIDLEQLMILGKLYDGQELSPEIRLGIDDSADEEDSLFELSVWDMTDDLGQIKYNAWFYMVDSGTIFKNETTKVAAEVIQCGLESDDDLLAQQIFAAVNEIRDLKRKEAELINIIPPRN